MAVLVRSNASTAAPVTALDTAVTTVTATGKIDGQRILPRDIPVRRYQPVRATGKLVVVVPGFPETSEDWGTVAEKLSAAGHTALVMDPPWTAHHEGVSGAFGLARDVAAVAAHAYHRARHDGSATQIVLLGAGLGASVGVLAATLLNDAGRVELDGLAMPRSVRGVLIAPLLQPSRNSRNWRMDALSRVPGLGSRRDAARRLLVLSSAQPDLERLFTLIGECPEGPDEQFTVLHAHRDPVADPRGSERLVELLRGRARLRTLNSDHHRLHHQGGELRYVLSAI